MRKVSITMDEGYDKLLCLICGEIPCTDISTKGESGSTELWVSVIYNIVDVGSDDFTRTGGIDRCGLIFILRDVGVWERSVLVHPYRRVVPVSKEGVVTKKEGEDGVLWGYIITDILLHFQPSKCMVIRLILIGSLTDRDANKSTNAS